MAYRNKCSFIGYIGRDIEVKTFGDQSRLGNTSLAMTKKWRDNHGVKQERTTWVSLTFPGGILDNAVKFVTKGKLVIVDGELDLREYEKDGQKIPAVSIRVNDYQLLGPKGMDNAADAASGGEDAGGDYTE